MAKDMKRWAWAWLPAASLLTGAAAADVYTWVDASGNVNVSNLAPPAGARVTNVAHENPAAIARAEAARAAAHEAEVRALADRVDELERVADAAARMPPPAYPLPAAPPPPQYTVTVMPPDVPEPLASSYWAGCTAWDCWQPGWPGWYAAPVVVLSPPLTRGRSRHRPHGGPQHGAGAPPPHGLAMSPAARGVALTPPARASRIVRRG